MRRGRTVSRPVRTTLWVKSARMAASMRGVRRRVNIALRGGGGGFLWVEGSRGDVGNGGGGIDGWFVRSGVESEGIWALSELLEKVPYIVASASTFAFLGVGSRRIRRRKSSATSCWESI